MKKFDLNIRLFEFAIRVLKFLKSLPLNPECKVIRYQLAKSSGSAGANYEEAQAGSSRADFNNKIRISLREIRESNYWLRIIKSLVITKLNRKELEYLINESSELKKILGSILIKTNL